MSVKKAILIQDISEYLGIMRPYVRRVLFKYNAISLNMDNIIRWIIEEELELIYGVFINGHVHNKYPEIIIHNILNREMHAALSIVTSNHIKAPKIYGDIESVYMSINKFDLTLMYYSNVKVVINAF